MRAKFVLFGDSITEQSFDNGGWGSALANHFARKADIVLRGYSGYNTRWALKILGKVMDGVDSSGRHAPAVVTVFFGANDACLPDRCAAFQHVPIAEYQHNLRSICSSLKERWTRALVIVIAPPPIDEDGRLKYPYEGDNSGLPERTNDFTGEYAKACISVANELSIPVIDAWSKMQQISGWEKSLLSDGLHLTAEGNRVVFEEVLQKLKEGGLSLEKLPSDLPLFSEIDRNDPLKTFSNLVDRKEQ